ncbi:MAG: sarcosine oxidase subunit delta [Rhodobiaceae bacterium]|nr:sarcosine oxidase subunit delta [Rhodobiaceae bacterium]
MLVVKCPVCGIEGEEADFHCGGEAHVKRPQSKDPENVSDEALRDYLYLRQNPRGLHREMWHCTRGCGKWFNAVRDTVTLDFKAFYRMDQKPPALEKFEGDKS